jgi:hypothetical protein
VSDAKRDDDAWQAWWDDRMTALEELLGPSDPNVMHSWIPLGLGGRADVITFRPPKMGVTYVTADLIGSEQPESSLGQYELMICQGDDSQEWAPHLISQLAAYTLEVPLQPWDTMTISPAIPDGSNIVDALFVPFAEFEVRSTKCGLLLVLGLTQPELDYCAVDCDPVIDKLKEAGEYPFTTLDRQSVM